MRTATILCLVLSAASVPIGSASAQVSCFTYGQFTSCDGPNNQHTTQMRLNHSMGTIQQPDGTVEPYAMFPSTPQPVRPLNQVLPTLETPKSQPNVFLDNGSFLDAGPPVFVPYDFGGPQ